MPNEFARPAQCPLCHSDRDIVSAGFRQAYAQDEIEPVFLEWWECRSCDGWFAFPLQTPVCITRYWKTVGYNDPAQEADIGQRKTAVYQKVLRGIRQRCESGQLLDFGCNFGQFMAMALNDRFAPVGFDSYETAVNIARARGFDVRCGWSLERAGFSEGQFAAISAIDVFYYSWHPYRTLETFFQLLQPGGVLAMRVSNKRLICGVLRSFARTGDRRDSLLSRMLQSQFHSIGLKSLRDIMSEIGFVKVSVLPRASTAPWSASSWLTRMSYLFADVAYILSLTRCNLHPGVLIFAQKPDP
jgi:SAM-dependent methyltransferase